MKQPLICLFALEGEAAGLCLGDSLAECHTGETAQPEFEGAPLPYSLRADDAVMLTLLTCFFLSSTALYKGKKFLMQQLKEFMITRERNSIFDSSTASDVRYLIVLVAQTCMLAAVVFFYYFHTAHPQQAGQLPSVVWLGSYAGSCLAYFLLKWGLYRFIGWIFFDKNKTKQWLESYLILIYYAGFTLFPFALLFVFFDINLTYLASFGLSILIFAKMLMFCKWIKIFSRRLNSLFPLILYFCALEIVPCLLVYGGLIRMNNLLLIKI